MRNRPELTSSQELPAIVERRQTHRLVRNERLIPEEGLVNSIELTIDHKDRGAGREAERLGLPVRIDDRPARSRTS